MSVIDRDSLQPMTGIMIILSSLLKAVLIGKNPKDPRKTCSSHSLITSSKLETLKYCE